MDAFLSTFYPVAIFFLFGIIGYLIKRYVSGVDTTFKSVKENSDAFALTIRKEADRLKSDVKELRKITNETRSNNIDFTSKLQYEIIELRKDIVKEAETISKLLIASTEEAIDFKNIISDLKLSLKEFKLYKQEINKKITLNKTSISWLNKDMVRVKETLNEKSDLINRSLVVVEKLIKKTKEG